MRKVVITLMAGIAAAVVLAQPALAICIPY